MHNILLSVSLLLGLSLLIYKLFRGKVHYALCLSSTPAAASIFLYFCALGGLLVPATTVLSITAIAGGLWSIWWLVIDPEKRSEFIRQLLTPSIIISVACISFLGYYFRTASLNNWDEFSHWGISIKYLLRSGHFPVSNHDTCCSDYPPFQPLFIYFFSRWGNSSEASFFLGKFLLIILPIAIILYKLTWRQSIIGLILFITCMFAILYPSTQLAALTADNTLALYGAIPVALLILEPQSKIHRYLAMFFIFTIPLIKPVGTVLAGISALTISSVVLSGWIFNKRSLRSMVQDSLYVVGLFLVIIVSRATWKFYLLSLGIKEHFGQDISLSKIKGAFGAAATPRHIQVIGALKSFLLGDYFTQACIAVGIGVVAIGIITILLSLLNRESRRPFLTGIFGLSIASLGISIWVAVHIVAYLFKFSDYEAVRLASIYRYLGIYFCFITLLCTALFSVLLTFFDTKRSLIAYAIQPFALLICLWIQIPVIKWVTFTDFSKDTITTLTKTYQTFVSNMSYLIYADKSINVRNKIENRTRYEAVSKHISPSDKLWIIYQGSDGGEYWLWRYELAGIGCNLWFWSLASKPYSPSDIWTFNWTPERWLAELEEGKYTHVILGQIDHRFKREYSSLFPEGEKFESVLYKIQKQQGGETKFIPVADSGLPILLPGVY